MKNFRSLLTAIVAVTLLGSIGCFGDKEKSDKVFLKVPVEGSDGERTVWYVTTRDAFGPTEACPLDVSALDPKEDGALYVVCCARKEPEKPAADIIAALDSEMRATFKTAPSRMIFAPKGAHLCKH